MGKGKRKLPMELIGKKENRMVSFSKRRKGLIKKAEEFHSLTGSSIALIVISEAGRPSVYGAPSFDSVLHRFQLQQRNNGMLSTHSHSHNFNSHSTATTPQTLLLLGDQGGSNQEVVNVVDREQWPETTLDLPNHHSFDSPSELLIPQGSTTSPSVPMAASPEDDNCLFGIDTLPLLLDGQCEDNAAVNGTHPDHPTPDYESVVVAADQEPWPEVTLDLPHLHSFDSPSEFLIPQGFTTVPSVPMAASPDDDDCLFDIDTLLLLLDDKAEYNAAVNGTHPDHTTPDDENVGFTADQEPSPTALALPHPYSFYTSLPPDQVVDWGSNENDTFPVFN